MKIRKLEFGRFTRDIAANFRRTAPAPQAPEARRMSIGHEQPVAGTPIANSASRRPLSLFERTLYCNGRLPGNVAITACIDGGIDEQALIHALAEVQRKHPLLRCLIVEQDGRPWFVRQEAPPSLSLRIVERLGDDDWIEQSACELARCFDGLHEPLARLTWLRGEARSDLLLICHHAICDGRSVVNLLDELLRLCSRPACAIGRYHSLDGFVDLLPESIRSDRHLQRFLRWRAAGFKLLLRLLARSKPAVEYGAVYRDLWTLDETVGQGLAERCRAQQVTVYVTISLAFILAFRAVLGPRRIKRFHAPVDIRRYLSTIKPDSLFAVAPTVMLRAGKTRAEEPAAAEFWSQARALQSDLRARIEGLAPKVNRTYLGLEYLHDVFDQMFEYARSQRTGYDVTLSYLGRLPLARDYEGFRLRAVRGISAVLGLTPAHLVVFSRLGDCFDFVLASDESSLTRAQAQQIREKTMGLLLKLAADPTAGATPE